MPAHINHNAHLNRLQRNLSLHYSAAARNVEQLASGSRVNRSSDDPASLALANSLHSEVRALSEGERNIQQMVHMMQVADGTLGTMSEIILRMQGLATQASSDTYQATDRETINAEFQALRQEINRLAESATYNGIPLLSGDTTLTVQSGPSASGGDVGSVELHDLRTGSALLDMDTLAVSTRTSATQTMDKLQTALQVVADERNGVAAFQIRLELNAMTSGSIMERMLTSESTMREADVAATVAGLAQSQILSQTAASVAMEADTDVERILSLLQR
jgi:flagellin